MQVSNHGERRRHCNRVTVALGNNILATGNCNISEDHRNSCRHHSNNSRCENAFNDDGGSCTIDAVLGSCAGGLGRAVSRLAKLADTQQASSAADNAATADSDSPPAAGPNRERPAPPNKDLGAKARGRAAAQDAAERALQVGYAFCVPLG